MKIKGVHEYLIHILCGAVASLPVIFDCLPYLSWIAFAPIVYLSLIRKDEQKKRYRRAYLRGLAYFYAYGLGVFYWFVELYPLDFAGMTKGAALTVVIVAWFGLPLLQAIFSAFMFVLWELLYAKFGLKDKKLLIPVTIASLYISFEFLQTLTWAGVPWTKLALTQTALLPVIQSASLFGPYFIGFLIIIVNSLIALAAYYSNDFLRDKKLPKRGIALFMAAVVIFSANIIYGSVAIGNKDYKIEENRLTAAGIQANISSKDKWDSDKNGTVFERYRKLTLEAAAYGADIIVWPETAMPYVLNTPFYENVRSALSALAVKADANLIVGGFEATDGTSDLKNSLYHISKDGVISDQTYVKRRLVPFGEFVPMRDVIMTLIPPLAEISMLQSDLISGDTSALIATEYGELGGIICFDSIYEELVRTSAKDGADIITVSTNDSWFSDSAAVYEHNRHSVLRAVENGKYVVRAANTGISSIISPRGEVITSLEPLVDGFVLCDIYSIDGTTLYTETGNTILLLAWLWLIGSSTFVKINLCQKTRTRKDI